MTANDSDDALRFAREGDAARFRAALEALDLDTLDNLTETLEDEELFAAAEVVYRLLIEQESDESEHWENLGLNLYYHQREPERAEACYADALRLFPDSVELLSARGVNLAWSSARYMDALPYLKAAVQKAPDGGGYRSALAWCQLCLGDREEGLRNARRAFHQVANDQFDAKLRIECRTYLYLLGSEEEQGPALRFIARAVATKGTTEDWDFDPLMHQAIAQKHSSSAWLPGLIRVVNGESQRMLEGWPAWEDASQSLERRFDWREGLEPPSLLQSLARFVGDGPEGEAISAKFRLEGDDDASAWCRHRPEAAADYAVFGRDSDGSLYALSLAAEPNPENAPVVCLRAGTEERLVMAPNFREFLALLGLCLPALGATSARDEPWAEAALRARKDERTLSRREKEFRRWLQQEHGISVPSVKEAEAIVANARATYAASNEHGGQRSVGPADL